MTFTFVTENSESRHKLEELVRRLSDEDLARTNATGWTVAALLAHLAFWDRRALVLIHRWKAKGVDESPIDPDAMNDALMPLYLAIAPHTAVELCLSSAEAVDAELETVSRELFEQIESSPTHYRFSRALHRDDHRNEIEVLLSLSRGSGGA